MGILFFFEIENKKRYNCIDVLGELTKIILYLNNMEYMDVKYINQYTK